MTTFDNDHSALVRFFVCMCLTVVPPDGWSACRGGAATLEREIEQRAPIVRRPLRQSLINADADEKGVYNIKLTWLADMSMNEFRNVARDALNASTSSSSSSTTAWSADNVAKASDEQLHAYGAKLEKRFWRELAVDADSHASGVLRCALCVSFCSSRALARPPADQAVYGADMPGSLMDKGVPWNMCDLDSLLRLLPTSVAGVNVSDVIASLVARSTPTRSRPISTLAPGRRCLAGTSKTRTSTASTICTLARLRTGSSCRATWPTSSSATPP